MKPCPSWGRLIPGPRNHQKFSKASADWPPGSVLAYGNGRSYGDSCHNDRGTLLTLHSSRPDIILDDKTGILSAPAGTSLSDLLKHVRGSQWFLPVLPGTKFVTLGGAIANDIHGKNHETRGTFGCHIRSFELVRSDGTTLQCSAKANADLFAATIGGLGLTGMITRAKLQLMEVPGQHICETKTPFGNLDAFFDLEEEASAKAEYTVAWLDSLATGKSLGKGILISGNHVADPSRPTYAAPRIRVPFTPPVPLVSGLPLRLFNKAYFHRNSTQEKARIVEPNSFFFPLDAVADWNRLYGPKGLHQHQCVIPQDRARETIAGMIATSQAMGQGSFLTVLKRFGTVRSPGLMSFPRPGFTLTLDFAHRGPATLNLLERLDQMTLDAGGRTNPYKDARMSASTFQRGFPDWQRLEELRDPAFNSDFWRRTTSRQSVNAPNISTPSACTPAINQAAKGGVQKARLQQSSTERDAYSGMGKQT